MTSPRVIAAADLAVVLRLARQAPARQLDDEHAIDRVQAAHDHLMSHEAKEHDA